MQRITICTIVLTLISLNLASAQVASVGTSVTPVTSPQATTFGARAISVPTAMTGTGHAVLVVPSTELAPEQAGELAEDLDVMCAVFDKFLSDAGVKMRSWGTSVHRRRRSTRCINLPNSGPVFLMEAEFPLAPVAQEAPKQDKAPDADPLWAEVKSSMRSPGATSMYKKKQAQQQYDELKVVNLKGTLLRAIKHASNVCHIGRDEQIAIVVVETSQSNRVVTTLRVNGMSESSYNTIAPAAVGPTNVLTLRATKGQVDAVARKELTAEKFESSVNVLSYPLPLLQSTGR